MEQEQHRFDMALDGYRVLDLADSKGLYCTKLMADLGADVIKVEPPGGDSSRDLGPFYHHELHREKSLSFFNLNTNKRSITLNLEKADGREIFKQLVKNADIMVETFPPRYLDALGLGYSVLREMNRRLVMTSITPFGQEGPYRDYNASDIVGVAMGGQMYLCGFPDKPPVRPGASQGYHQASLHAAVGTLLALYYREMTGEGQHVDTSMQEAVSMSLETTQQFFDLTGEVRKRTGREYRRPASGLFKCQDGYVFVGAERGWDALVDWMTSKGMGGDLNDEKYKDPQIRLNEIDHIHDLFIPFVMSQTRAELYEEAQRRRIILAPVQDIKEIVEDPQLEARGYFYKVEHTELNDTLTYPGPPYHLSETPWQIRRRPPLIGEHNSEIYEGELGYTKAQLAILKSGGVI
ncbi:MAG: CoA transferase [Candidatus Tectomicrobia bacterium]|nr:CoA transferase [Candidatus Tectomicrobia bacterium]